MKLRYLLGLCLYITVITAMEEQAGRISPNSPSSLALSMEPIKLSLSSSPVISISEDSGGCEGSEKELVQKNQSSSSETESEIQQSPTALRAIGLELQVHNTALEHISANIIKIRTLLEEQNKILRRSNVIARKQAAAANDYKKLQIAHKVLTIGMLRDRRFQGVDAEMWGFVDQAAKQLVGTTEPKERKKSRGKKRKISLSNTTAKKNEDKIARDATKK